MSIANLVEEIKDLVLKIDQRDLSEKEVNQLYNADEQDLIETKNVLLLAVNTETLYHTYDDLY
jgi:hypothetical protein